MCEAPGRFARGGKLWFDRVVIETTGLGDAVWVFQMLMTDTGVERYYRLDGVIATVEAVNGDGTLDRQVESVEQAAMADRLIVTTTKTSIVTTRRFKRFALPPMS